MANTFSNIKETVISGVILFLPIFILLLIFKKLYDSLYGIGHKLCIIFGLDKMAEMNFVPILTTILLVIVLYLFGLMVRFAMVTKIKEWIENNVLIYIPTYSKYKAKMMAKLQPEDRSEHPVLVQLGEAWKPGFLMNAADGKSTVFLPTTPDTDYGEVWIVQDSKVTTVEMTPKEFRTSILLSGKGIKTGKSRINKE
ncbi:hypothetical protein RB619_20855 [Flavobacterium sp. LHD-80]|uniref:hypothetical protein n=1 Tax=Flavobacterium sp. LHD-80 TaxID=3071411 RepID=UPI0027E1122B|nr:hypothetical protein [Flavobacterium sp. LHD-80]MDQ6473098.1 hypothetical protein [Flavobacterium sp. LHD-80]